jgi:hypothetical protein
MGILAVTMVFMGLVIVLEVKNPIDQLEKLESHLFIVA